MAVLRLFAAAREAAGVASAHFDAPTVGGVLDQAVGRYGPDFAAVLAGSRVWLNGDPAGSDEPVTDQDEVAVLPPVSGGSLGVVSLP
jgi:molybdopterin synthase sulfur carrier subunit